MIYDLTWLLAEVFGVILLVLFLRAVQLNFAANKTRQRLVSQGIFDYPGNDTSLFGAAMAADAEFQKRLAKSEIVPHRALFGLNLLGEKDWTPDKPKLDASKYPMVS